MHTKASPRLLYPVSSRKPSTYIYPLTKIHRGLLPAFACTQGTCGSMENPFTDEGDCFSTAGRVSALGTGVPSGI